VAISGLSIFARRTAAVLPFLAVLSACATTGAARTSGPAAPLDRAEERGPRVHLWTTDEFGSRDRVRPAFRLEDDAYVIVVNVGLDGYARVIFPESPDDDGFMRGGRTYRLPAFFPGFANTFRSSRYGRLYHATSAYDDIYDQYAGYVFVIASWRPMHFKITEAIGLWDDYELVSHDRRLTPYVVMHEFAEKLVPGRRDYTARFARYAAFTNRYGRASSFASCAAYGWPVDIPSWLLASLYRSWVPVYGLGYYSFGPPTCGVGFGRTLVGFRPRGQPVVPAPMTPPVRPRPPADTGGARPPVKPRDPRSPVAEDDDGTRKGPRRRSGAPVGRRVDAEAEPIIDVTKESRALARRQDRDAERTRRAVDMGRGYRRPDRWDGSDRSGDHARDYERPRANRDGDRDDASRAQRREPADHGRARAEHPRDGRPPSEPRHEPARSEPRSQPAPRHDPPARSEPAARSDPRGERPAKPERQ
jgi:hypothetical protein